MPFWQGVHVMQRNLPWVGNAAEKSQTLNYNILRRQ